MIATTKTVLRAEIPGEPVPKGRPRLGRYGNTYTPRATLEAERDVAMSFRAQNPGADPLTGPLVVTMRFRTAKTKAGGKNRASDLDNYAKLVLDALNGVAWEDDVQIVKLDATVERGDVEPGTEIEVRRAE